MGETSYLNRLLQAGLTVEARPGNSLWLSPKTAITEEIRAIVREHKAEILAELHQTSSGQPAEQSEEDIQHHLEALKRAGPLRIPCDCGKAVDLLHDHEEWYRFSCRCGRNGYVTLRDYLRWKQRGGRGYAGAAGRT